MLVVLDPSLAPSLAADPNHHNPVAIAIDATADAARRGFHVLHASVATFDALSPFAELLGPRTASLLERAKSRTPFRGALLEEVRWYVRISAEIANVVETVTATGAIEISLPALHVATVPSLLERTLFIAENANDAKFYEALALSFVKTDVSFKRRFSEVKFKYLSVPGGGHTTAQVYAHHKHLQENFCLAIVDSDKKYPGGSTQETADALRAVDAAPNLPNWNAHQYIIEVRAVENAFPRQVLLQTSKALDDHLHEVAQNIVVSHWGTEYWPYIPLKKGLRCFDISSSDSAAATYWRTALGFGQCPNLSGQGCESREHCSTRVIDPLGTSLLGKLCATSPIEIPIDLNSDAHIIAAARPLYSEMLTAFCADEPVLP